jgi:hypothetical protein
MTIVLAQEQQSSSTTTNVFSMLIIGYQHRINLLQILFILVVEPFPLGFSQDKTLLHVSSMPLTEWVQAGSITEKTFAMS